MEDVEVRSCDDSIEGSGIATTLATMAAMSPSPSPARATPQPPPSIELEQDEHSQQRPHSDAKNSDKSSTTASYHREPASAASPEQVRYINTISYRSSVIKAQIDTTMAVADVIRQLCANAHLGVQEPPALFALRDDDSDELIDDHNLAAKIRAAAAFKLTASPLIEAAEMVDKLSSRDEKALKMATYTLQKLIKEPPFVAEFMRRGGLNELVAVVLAYSSGNTLAYALTSCLNLLQTSELGWDIFDMRFVTKVVRLLVAQERINVCRPATAILQQLLISKPSPNWQSSTKTHPSAISASHPANIGFNVIYQEIRREPAFLPTLVQRLSSADTRLCLHSLSLLNSLMTLVSNEIFFDFSLQLEALETSSSVARLMEANFGGDSDELAASVLDYQSNVAKVLHRRMHMPVKPADKRHVAALTYIWKQACVGEENMRSSRAADTPGERATSPKPSAYSAPATAPGRKIKWRQIGFANENVARAFSSTGWLGLECCEAFIRADAEGYAQLIAEQLELPEARRCPWGRASTEVVEILADHWNITSGQGCTTECKPFLLFFQRVHNLVLRFFFRVWAEAGAVESDFAKASALVRSHLNYSLQDEGSKTWADLEEAFLHSPYRSIRERHMSELNMEDDWSGKPALEGLKAKLLKESYAFVRQQRIQCLLDGAWFRVASKTRYNPHHGRSELLAASASAPDSSLQPWRFYRLALDCTRLHYRQAVHPQPVFELPPGTDAFPDFVDLSQVAEIALHSAISAVSTTATRDETEDSFGVEGDNKVNRRGLDLKHSLSLLCSSQTSLVDLIATTPDQWSEWVDGLLMLRGEEHNLMDGSHTERGHHPKAAMPMHTNQTIAYVEALADIGLKVRLLDITGEGVEVPAKPIKVPPLPDNFDFFFADV